VLRARVSDATIRSRLLYACTWLLHLVSGETRSVPDVWRLLSRSKPTTNLASLVKRWGERLVSKGDVHTTPPSGRPRGSTYITQQEAYLAANDVLEGDENGRRFSSVAAAAASSPHIERIITVLAEHEITQDSTILRAINDLTGANLHFGIATVKKRLSQEVRKKRRNAAWRFRVLLRAQADFLCRIVQIDSKKLWVATCLSGRHVLLHGEDLGVEEDERLRHKNCCINYYIAVNAKAGVVHLKFVTGTTGLNTGLKVSHYSTLGACTS